MKNIFLLIVVIGSILFQDKLPYDATKVTDEKELNFYQTDKRGIRYNDVVYYVENDLNKVTAYRKDGKIKWRSDVSKVIQCSSGKAGIRFIKIEKEKLSIVYAKHDFGEIDLKTGKVTYLYSD